MALIVHSQCELHIKTETQLKNRDCYYAYAIYVILCVMGLIEQSGMRLLNRMIIFCFYVIAEYRKYFNNALK